MPGTLTLTDEQVSDFRKSLESRPEYRTIRSIQEANREASVGLHRKAHRKMVEDYKHLYKIDLSDKRNFDFSNLNFNWMKFRESVGNLCRNLRETNAEGAFGQLMRAGAQTIANSWYELTDVTYRSWITESSSNKRQEWYPPVNRVGLPRRVEIGADYPEVKMAGLDQVIVNHKEGGIASVERELWDDDQTGQISQRFGQMGEGMAVKEEIYAYARFIGAATSYLGEPIPASQTKPTNEGASVTWPWTTNAAGHAFIGGGYNRPTTYVLFNKTNLITAWQQLYSQLDLLGNKMLVTPDTIICSRIDTFDVKIILNSQWYPTVPGSAGTTGASFAMNPLQGLANEVTSRFMPDKAWALGQANRGIIFQRRDPTEIIQENPASGPSFQADVYRYRSRARWEIDWVDPRFWFLGDDGSV